MRNINITDRLILILSIGLSGFLLYTAYFGTFYPYFQRSVPLTIAIVLAFLTLNVKGLKTKGKVPVYDWILALVAIPVFGYAALYSDHLANRWPMSRMSVPSYLEITFGIMSVLLLMEAVRRTIGITLVLVVVLMLFYTLFGDLISWQAISHPGYSLIDAVDHYYLTMEGLWGSTLGIATSYVALFVIFGAFMEKSGATNFFVDLSNAIAGESRGGPAKVAIFASGFVGSVTGSTVANVYTTGQLSIPLMKSVGYRPSFAGAVEALASNGGQIMPPLMGAGAFVMVELTGILTVRSLLSSDGPDAVFWIAGLVHTFGSRETGYEGFAQRVCAKNNRRPFTRWSSDDPFSTANNIFNVAKASVALLLWLC